MKINYPLIYVLIGFLTGLSISLIIGILTITNSIIIGFLALLGGFISHTSSSIFVDEFKRWRDKIHEREKVFKSRFRNHTIEQIIPVLEKWIDLKFVRNNIWRDIIFGITVANYDFFQKFDYYDETVDHLKSSEVIWSHWEELLELKDKFNEQGGKLIDVFVNKIEEIVSDKLPELNKKYDRTSLPFNHYLPLGIIRRILFQRFYKILIEEEYNKECYKGEIRQGSLYYGNQDVIIADQEAVVLMSEICVDISKNIETIFPDAITNIKKLQDFFHQIEEKYNQYQRELKLLVSKIKAGDPLMGRCSICRDWFD